jgi:cytoskeletal protein CcmA (bactofilin family)
MRRRRMTKVLAGLAAMGIAGVALVGTLSAVATHAGAVPRGLVALRSVAAALGRPLERVALPAVAAAGEVLDFKPVPRESVARFERLKVVRRTPAPDPTDTLSFDRATPAVPEAPEAPEPPADVTDRSGGVMKIGSDIYVGPDEVVHGDLSSVNGDITIEGHVEGDVVAMKGDVELKSTAKVDGDVVCLGGELTEEPGSQVSGQKVTTPGSGARRIRGARERHGERIDGDRVAGTLVWLLMLTLFGWLFVRFAPGRTVAATDLMRRSPALSLGLGSLVWALIIPSIIALALVVALLCITIIGIPLALAALVGYVLFLIVLTIWGFIIAATVMGGAISNSMHHTAPVAPVASGPTGSVEPVPGGAVPGVATTPYAPLTRPMLTGVVALMGAILFGRILQLADFGPIHGFGTLFVVLGTISSIVATTIGAGALLRSEIIMGTFQRVWNGRRFGNGAARAAAAQDAAPPPPPTAAWTPEAPIAPLPPPPPSPPASYMPPPPPPQDPPAPVA